MDQFRQVGARRARRRGHVRRLTRGTPDRPRLTVFRSGKHISAQIVDDDTGKTLAAASTYQKDLVNESQSTANKEAAKRVGAALAERAKSVGVLNVRFDRGHYKYHGRVAALADAAREAGLKF